MPFQRPGTYVSEVTTLDTAIPDSPTAAITVFVEQCNRGEVNTPVLISSWNEFVTKYGGFSDTTLYLPFAVWQFFNNGGAQCYIDRVIGASGTVAATVTITDNATTAQSTLSATAKSVGSWGNSLNIQAVNRSTTRFDLILYDGAATDANRVETWLDLSMTDTDTRYVETVINAIATGSRYITVLDLDSSTAAPSDRPLAGTYSFLLGANGAAPSITEFTTALNSVDQIVSQALTLNLPGQSTNNIVAAAITYVEGRGDSFLVIDTSSALGNSAAVLAETDLLSETSYGAVYFPWLNTVDPSSAVSGATRLLPPGGAVCGVISRTDVLAGPYKAPAGLAAKIGGVVSLERKLPSTELDSLNDGYVNAIRQHPVGGIVVFGARTLSRTAATRYVPVRRSLNYVKDSTRRLSDFAVFETNDETTWRSVTTRLENFLSEYWQGGGLNGEAAQEAFYVICDSSNNTASTIAAGELHIEVGVAVLSPAEFIVIQIGQYDGGATAVEV